MMSEQANNIVKNLKEFDLNDFEKFWLNLAKVTPAGAHHIIQYLDMKERGIWKDGEFQEPKKDGG